MSKKTNNQTAKVNWPITILLIIGCLTVFFPLYMAVIIAFKKPSEMTNDVAGDESNRFLAFSGKQFTAYDRDRDPCYSDPFSGRICDRKKHGK